MSNLSKRSFTLDECKIQAQILLKHLTSDKQANVSIAKNRFTEANIIVDDISNIKLKDALQVIASEYGFMSYINLKMYFDKTSHTIFKMHSGFLNQWFANYQDAKAYLHSLPRRQNFLLPFKSQFFICEDVAIEHFGLDSKSADWQKIGYNWVEPVDMLAWSRLNQMLLGVSK